MEDKVSTVSKQKVLNFMSANGLATLATINRKGTPHAATVQIIVHDDFSVYFSTRVEARKFLNILTEPTVAMAITDSNALITVQLTGKVERVVDLQVEQALLEELWKLRFSESAIPGPAAQMFERGITNEVAVIKVTPTELSYATFAAYPSGKYHPFFHKII
jgi:uncharacterized pyridoxamine 5'-phosphate oxidase family protein